MFSDPNPDTWLHWLYTNAPAAWLSALIASIAFLVSVRSRKKARRLVVKEVRNASVARIWPSIRHKVEMTFDGRPITALSQVEAEIFNEGSDPIEQAELTITVPKDCLVLDASVTPEELNVLVLVGAHDVTIKLPYVNPIREHAQVVKLSVLTDGEAEPILVSGSGLGWSVLYRSDSKKTWMPILLAFVAGLATLGAAEIWYVPFLQHRFGIGPSEFSLRAAIANAPFF